MRRATTRLYELDKAVAFSAKISDSLTTVCHQCQLYYLVLPESVRQQITAICLGREVVYLDSSVWESNLQILRTALCVFEPRQLCDMTELEIMDSKV